MGGTLCALLLPVSRFCLAALAEGGLLPRRVGPCEPAPGFLRSRGPPVQTWVVKSEQGADSFTPPGPRPNRRPLVNHFEVRGFRACGWRERAGWAGSVPLPGGSPLRVERARSQWAELGLVSAVPSVWPWASHLPSLSLCLLDLHACRPLSSASPQPGWEETKRQRGRGGLWAAVSSQSPLTGSEYR